MTDMWIKPWTFKEGFMIGAGLLIIGILLQFSVGPVDWTIFAFPFNVAVALCLLVMIVWGYALHKRMYWIRFSMTGSAAVPALLYTAALTVLMGLTPQVMTSSVGNADLLGISRMLSFWPFVLIYLWVTVIVGLVGLKQLAYFIHQRNQLASLLSHCGLFIALVAGTLGNADMQRLEMTVKLGKPEWRAMDNDGKAVELPLAVSLHDFSIDEYPPKLVIIDNTNGKVQPENHPENMVVENSATEGMLLDWHIKVGQRIDYAAQVTAEDSAGVNVRYEEWPSVGATSAVFLTARHTKTGSVKEGWVSCGSFAFPYHGLTLDERYSIVMPEREPQKYASVVSAYTQSGEKLTDTILVNKPLEVEGWKVYQVSYDENLGRWSDTSVFELVRDPWLPVVYTGIILMLVGAVLLFFRNPRKGGIND